MVEHVIANGILLQMKLKSVPPLTGTLSVEIVILIKNLMFNSVCPQSSQQASVIQNWVLSHFHCCNQNTFAATETGSPSLVQIYSLLTMDDVPRWCLSNED